MNEISKPLSNLAAIDAAHHLHPFSDMGKLNAAGTRIIERAEGVFIYDSTGKKYLDAFAGLWCVNIGYGRREIADVVQRQMNEPALLQRVFRHHHAAGDTSGAENRLPRRA